MSDMWTHCNASEDHLATSLSDYYSSVFASVEKELRRLYGLNWYDFTADFAFWPMYLNGQGATARKLEPDRYRRTTEGGA